MMNFVFKMMNFERSVDESWGSSVLAGVDTSTSYNGSAKGGGGGGRGGGRGGGSDSGSGFGFGSGSRVAGEGGAADGVLEVVRRLAEAAATATVGMPPAINGMLALPPAQQGEFCSKNDELCIENDDS